jgi:Cu/Ag efflux pump CusA
MAIVVLGGLVTSTFLNLVVVPAGYAMIFRAPRLDAADTVKIDQIQEERES